MSANLVDRLKASLADRYAIEREIGRGGMATVFLAEDLKHGRKVALKVLHPEIAATLGTDRFLREIQIAAHLEHPGILPLHDSGEAEGLPYFVMPYVEGESLRERLEREGPMPVDEALAIAAEVADALDYAHERGVVHRDIKPGNVLLSAGHARVADFGVARAVGAASGGEGTLTGLAVGTPKYMSPEQAAAAEVDGRADVYALGCVLWEMLAGEPPFDGPTPHAILARKAAETVPDLRVRRKSVPVDVESVIARAMAPLPVDRFETAGDFAGALKEPGLVGAATRRRRVRGRVLNAGVAIVLLAAGVWLAWLFAGGPAADEAEGEAVLEIDPYAIAVLPFQVTGTSDALKTLGRNMPQLFWAAVTGEYGPRAVDAGAVRELWATAGGTPETPLPEAKALEIARLAGAGRLVLGVVSGSEENMGLTATLLEVPGGEVRAGRIRVEGTYAGYEALAEELITRLLTGERGFAPEFDAERLRQITAHDPDAVQAALRGLEIAGQGEGSWQEAGELFDRALALDSTFVMAAYWKFKFGETDPNALRLVWDHLDELSPRDQALARGLIGGYTGMTWTVAEQIAQFDASGLADWETDAAYNLYSFGSRAGIPRWRERTKAASERARHLVSQSQIANARLFELAADEGDTAAMRVYSAELARLATTPAAHVTAIGTGLRLALRVGDDAAADSLWEEAALAVADTGVIHFLSAFDPLLLDGRGLDDYDRFIRKAFFNREDGSEPTDMVALTWARARGRYSEWKELRERYFESPRGAWPSWEETIRVRDALFLGEPEDSAVLAAATALAASERSSSSESWRIRSFGRCWSTLWRVARADTVGARGSVRYLEDPERYDPRWAQCPTMIEVLLARQEGVDAAPALARLDSIIRPGPLNSQCHLMQGYWCSNIEDLFLVRELARDGDTLGALTAARRPKPWNPGGVDRSGGTFLDLLREEARLAAAVGDTAGAVDTYSHYFALRDVRPDHPPWAAQWDSMRVEYGALTGVETP